MGNVMLSNCYVNLFLFSMLLQINFCYLSPQDALVSTRSQ